MCTAGSVGKALNSIVTAKELVNDTQFVGPRPSLMRTRPIAEHVEKWILVNGLVGRESANLKSQP